MDLLQDKNAVYLFTAYGVFLGGLGVYALSLWLRKRKLDRDEREITAAEEFESRTPER